MILEAIRIVSEALDDDVIGVNAKLGVIDKDPEDGLPPNIVKVLDATRDDDAAMGQAGLDSPVILVTSTRGTQTDGEVMTIKRASRIQITCAYITEDADSAQAVTDALYTLRAMQQSIKELQKNENITRRTRNSITLETCLSMQIFPSRMKMEGSNSYATGMMILEFRVVDNTP